MPVLMALAVSSQFAAERSDEGCESTVASSYLFLRYHLNH